MPSSSVPLNTLTMLKSDDLVQLQRNPQYLTPSQMDSLKASILRDGFCAPILVRRIGDDKYEIVSGNHRYMAAVELNMKEIPCVVADLTDQAARRLAINLNTIHGEPNAELLAPFLAELDEDILADIHIEKKMLDDLAEFNSELVDKLALMEVPESLDRDSPTHSTAICVCPKCGKTHVKKT